MPRIFLILIVVVLIAAAIWFIFLFFGGRSSNNSPATVNSFNIQNMKVEVERLGEGVESKIGDNLVVNYVTMLENGRKIDSSYDRNISFSFRLGDGQVIKGWDLGLVGMKVGEKRRLTVPPELAYGASGFEAAGIPPSSTLLFEVELVSIY